jgi:hypothetical protein
VSVEGVVAAARAADDFERSMARLSATAAAGVPVKLYREDGRCLLCRRYERLYGDRATVEAQAAGFVRDHGKHGGAAEVTPVQ